MDEQLKRLYDKLVQKYGQALADRIAKKYVVSFGPLLNISDERFMRNADSLAKQMKDERE